jgi:hypothetical protein
MPPQCKSLQLVILSQVDTWFARVVMKYNIWIDQHSLSPTPGLWGLLIQVKVASKQLKQYPSLLLMHSSLSMPLNAGILCFDATHVTKNILLSQCSFCYYSKRKKYWILLKIVKLYAHRLFFIYDSVTIRMAQPTQANWQREKNDQLICTKYVHSRRKYITLTSTNIKIQSSTQNLMISERSCLVSKVKSLPAKDPKPSMSVLDSGHLISYYRESAGGES